MFKEIENELLSIISDDTIEKIAHMPTKEIAKTMELLYKVEFENIQRVYTEDMGRIIRMTVMHNDSDKPTIDCDLCPINGKIYHITFLPVSLLNKSTDNAVNFSRALITYISSRVGLIAELNKDLIQYVDDNLLHFTLLQAIPVLTCDILRKIYSGPTLSKLIYMSLTELMSLYKTLYTEEGVDTILSLFDEGLGVTELLDNGFICSIKNNEKYPGIWCNVEKHEE